jgi:hypothetical protein
MTAVLVKPTAKLKESVEEAVVIDKKKPKKLSKKVFLKIE